MNNGGEIIGGYDAEFHPPLNEDFTCCICFLAFRDPMQLDCGHQYCRSCLEKYVETDGVQFTCPVDRQEMDINKIFPDKAMHKKVLSLTVKCKNLENSCDWSGELRLLEKHMESCPFISIKCTNEGCPITFLKSYLDHHLSNECKLRLIHCGFCMESYPFKCGQDHATRCEYYPIECINKCGEVNTPRKEMDFHLKICPLSILPCIFATLGCSFMGTWNQRDIHEKVDIHQHFQIAVGRIIFLEEQVQHTMNVIGKVNILEEEIALANERYIKLEQRLQANNKATSIIVKTPIEKAYEEVKMMKHGVFLWTIQDYQNKLEAARKSDSSMSSEQFLSSVNGYTLRLVVYPNGWSSGKGTHLGLCMQIAKGANDESLEWPFKHKISISILHPTDESKHKSKTRSPKPKDGGEINCSFLRPVGEYNSPNGWGDVISHESITNDGFLHNDTIHVMCKVLLNEVM